MCNRTLRCRGGSHSSLTPVFPFFKTLVWGRGWHDGGVLRVGETCVGDPWPQRYGESPVLYWESLTRVSWKRGSQRTVLRVCPRISWGPNRNGGLGLWRRRWVREVVGSEHLVGQYQSRRTYLCPHSVSYRNGPGHRHRVWSGRWLNHDGGRVPSYRGRREDGKWRGVRGRNTHVPQGFQWGVHGLRSWITLSLQTLEFWYRDLDRQHSRLCLIFMFWIRKNFYSFL